MGAAELGALTPAEVHEYMEAWRDRERRADFRAGQVCAVLAEVNRDRERKHQPFHPADFFASLEESRPMPTDVDLTAKLDALAALGGAS